MGEQEEGISRVEPKRFVGVLHSETSLVKETVFKLEETMGEIA
jgi:hypothetical protein